MPDFREMGAAVKQCKRKNRHSELFQIYNINIYIVWIDDSLVSLIKLLKITDPTFFDRLHVL